MKSKVHPYVPEMQEMFRQGRISRRDFLRMASLLGVSAAGATGMLAGCAPKATPVAPPPTSVPATAAVAPTAAPTTAPAPTSASGAKILAAGATPTPDIAGMKRGGELRYQTNIYKMNDPAASNIVEYNVWGYVTEYLAQLDNDNVVHPILLESWSPSDDLKTWTLVCRKGIKFNHGPEFNADDVVWNLKRWLDPATKTSATGLLGAYLQPTGIEKVDDYTVRLHLDKPQVAVAEHLCHYVCGVLPKDWQGDWQKQPYGTGPFTLSEYVVGERAVVKARKDYWRKGVDGSPLPYIDSIRMVYLGTDPAPAVAALQNGDIDVTILTAPLVDALKGSSNVTISSHTSGFLYTYRIRVDQKPFDDVRVRQAIKLCQDRQKIMDTTQRGYGALGEDHFVSPAHPEYTPLPPVARDTDKAKQLLAEAGYPNGLTVDLATMNTEPIPTLAQLLKEQCAPAGITVNIGTVTEDVYWNEWTDVAFGITSWTHRPLAMMTMDLAFRGGQDWNETHQADAAFDALLDQAGATFDLEKRKTIVHQLEQYLQEKGGVAVPCWNPQLMGIRNNVHNVRASADDHTRFQEAWLS